jgi:hypothetical protein
VAKEEEIVLLVTSRITECLENIPQSLLQNPPKILDRMANESSNEFFNEQQKELLERIGDSFYEVEVNVHIVISLFHLAL